MTQHTPGPWKMDAMRDGAGHNMITVDQDIKGPYREICRSYDIEPDDLEETKANARLIAAAPEMLDALKAMREALLLWKEFAPLAWDTADVIAIDKANKAINKAEGES
jgi:hypothetical protein